MKNKRYCDAQIMGILKQAESGVPVSELCPEPLPVVNRPEFTGDFLGVSETLCMGFGPCG